MVTPKYRCSQDELYQACFLLATSLEEELVNSDLKQSMQQQAYVDQYRDEVRAARLLPDDAQRKVQHIFLRTELIALTNGLFKQLAAKLRAYIRTAYPNPADEAGSLEAAGFGRYDAAMNYDWDAVTGFINSAISFTELNSAVNLKII
jgi:hypothetical protein